MRDQTADAVRKLVQERPDLVPHLRRCLALDDGAMEDVPQEALDEFVRRGLLVKDAR